MEWIEKLTGIAGVVATSIIFVRYMRARDIRQEQFLTNHLSSMTRVLQRLVDKISDWENTCPYVDRHRGNKNRDDNASRHNDN